MSHPNIVVLHCHDLGRHLGCYGVPTVRTPNIDALAADGVRFDNAFCTAPQCSPSRAALFTGRYPHATGVLGVTHGRFGWNLGAAEAHVAGLLRASGYRAELIEVHHESRTAEARLVAAQLGFDHVDTGGLARSVTERAVRRLTDLAAHDRPFYLQVGYVEPHRLPGAGEDGYQGFLGKHIEPNDARGVTVPPYLVDDAATRGEIAELQDAIAHMDDAVGGVLDALRSLGLVETTIVVFTTDHGLALPRTKCALYDPGIEVAMIIRYPGRRWVGGRAVGDLVSNVDITPTLLEAVGVPRPANLHGRIRCGLLDGASAACGADAVFAELTYHSYYDPRRCIRTSEHTLISISALRRRRWSRPTRAGRGVLRGCPSAVPAPITRHAVVRSDLIHRLHAWMDSTYDPLLSGAVADPMHAQSMAAITNA